MEKNKRLNPRTILNKPIYNSILSIIDTFQNNKVKFNHLKYALVEKDYSRIKEKMEEFFRYSVPAESLDFLTNEYEKGTINQKIYTTFMEVLKQNYLKKIEHKLGSESSLRDKLVELKNLGLIEKKSDKKGYPYYLLTDFGKKLYSRWSIHNMIESNITDQDLKEFNSVVLRYIFKKGYIPK